MWDDLVLVYFKGEVWKQEIEHLGFKAQYSNIYVTLSVYKFTGLEIYVFKISSVTILTKFSLLKSSQ